MAKFQKATSKEIEETTRTTKTLIVTATQVETKAFHKALLPLPPCKRCLSKAIGAQTYHVGRLGNMGVSHVECQMGSATVGASLVTIQKAVNFWKIMALVMLGIAFCVDPKKQKFGDVLVSKSIVPYETQRIGKKIIGLCT